MGEGGIKTAKKIPTYFMDGPKGNVTTYNQNGCKMKIESGMYLRFSE